MIEIKNKWKISKCLVFFIFFFLTSCSAFVEVVSMPERLKKIPVGTKIGDPFFFTFVAKNFYNKREYRRAIFYYKKAGKRILEIDKQKNAEYFWVTYEIAFCFYKMKKYSQAHKYFQEVMENKVNFVSRKLAMEMLERIAKKRKKFI